MKKITIFIAVLAMVMSFAGRCLAAEADEPVVYFDVPPEVLDQACKEDVWKGVTAKFAGAKDMRDRKEIGIQTKGDTEVQVISSPAIDVVMGNALKDLFQECGMNLLDKVPEGGMVITADVREFFIDVEKTLVSGKSRSESLITFNINKGGQITSIDIGMEIDGKDVRKKDIKAVRTAADKLLAETLKAIPANRLMREIK